MNAECGIMNDKYRYALQGFALIDCLESSISEFSIPN